MEWYYYCKTTTTKENNAMKNKYKPYMIDIKYECRTYQYVGRDYGNSKSADLSCIFNFDRFIRKIWNRKQTKYRFCNTYSDWEEHITNVLNKNIVNYDDMVHWLIWKRNVAKQQLEAVKVISIPIYMALIGVFSTFLNKEFHPMLELLIILIIIIAFCVFILLRAMDRVEFFDDFIKIAKGIKQP